MIKSKEKILEFMRQSSYAPLTAEDLIEAIPITGNLNTFWQDLKELQENGEIIKTRFGTFGLPERMGLVVGRVQLTSKGFGFVIPDNKGERPDVFIPPRLLNGAMNNDRVMARVETAGGDKRKPEGEIIRIIKHANNKIVGTFKASRDYGFVVPDDKRIGQDVYILKRNFNGAKTNQKVVVEITEWAPDSRRNIEGKIVEVLGNTGDVGMELLSLIKQYDLPLEFPEQVITASKRVPKTIKSTELEGRHDLRDRLIVTIDGDDAKDLDDAVFVQPADNGDFTLGVYIADVSHYVRENTILDREAQERGTSVYLVDRVLPMLPERLSNGICSLNAGEDRLVMCCEMLIDKKGRIKSYDIFPGVINVRYRLSYRIVREILVNKNAELTEKYRDALPMLNEMEKLCVILHKKRVTRGAIDFDLPEQKVILDEQGRPLEIVQREHGLAESIIEEFMLAANETVARHMALQKWPFIYRVHDKPQEEKMRDLSLLLSRFNVKMPVAAEVKPLALQKALIAMEGRPEERMVSTVALRSLKQAVYQTDNIGHFGLAAEYYTHFTSPIRRYPDLIVHRLLHKWLVDPYMKEKTKDEYTDKLDHIAEHSSIRERTAAEAERATVDLKKAEYMAGHIGEEYDGIISGVTAFGMFVELENGVEGLVHISSLLDDYYEFIEENYALMGTHTRKCYRLGDPVRIEVFQVNIAERNIDFILAGEDDSVRERIKIQLAEQRKTAPRYSAEPEKKGKKKKGKNKFAKRGKGGTGGNKYLKDAKPKCGKHKKKQRNK